MSGWIKLHRKTLEWEWWDDHNTSRLFFTLLMMANHGETKWRGIELKSGQLVTGRDQLSQKSGLSPQSVRTSLNKLKSTNEITIKSTNKFSIISITNWGLHQHDNQQSNQQLTNNQPATNQQLTTSKNVKNEKNGKKASKARPKDAQEVTEYAASIGFILDGQNFIDHYEANGWKRGNTSIKDWKACVRTWKKNASPDKLAVEQKQWHETKTGIMAKGNELGIPWNDDLFFPDYRKQVMERAQA